MKCKDFAFNYHWIKCFIESACIYKQGMLDQN